MDELMTPIQAARRPLVVGWWQPTTYQVETAWRRGDNSFTRPTDERFDADRPIPWGAGGRLWTSYPHQHGALLKMKCVEPHQDPWIGADADYCGEQLSMFWLLRAGGDVWFSVVGHEPVKMTPGHFVLFDDSVTHHVMSERLWAGVSWQQWPVDFAADKRVNSVNR